MDNTADFMSGFMTGEANNRNNGYGNGMFGGEMGFFWVFALLLLPAMMNGGGFWGGNGRGNAATTEDLCMNTSFTELKNSVGRGFDQQTQFAFQNQRDLCTSIATLSSQIASCCCDVGNQVQQNRYEASMNTAAINANTVAGDQKILDAICGLRMEMKDTQNAQLLQRVNQLEMQQLMCGVIRYPTATTYGAANPFFNCGCNTGCGCCGNNI